ncbi:MULTISPECIES: ExeA family protein [Photobacterium]|uniref:MSHA biogenesis protein MshM n=1 Tax=Photobacterium halotolerans TaxID=265726 RepID=A0A0F5VEP5_9GAMM|nr:MULTISPECIES: AAA family ATPase [Photobacterium]KKC99974.1 MSHA biogenesis protein MshM [Photobacterium halotolerans]UIP28257.1 AAA family ATPase [Photobacterium sp. TLY01]
MYLSHFGFEQFPFRLTPDTGLFHALPPHLEAIQMTLSALAMGEGVIQIAGEVGTGKTLVCRMLVRQLPEHYDLAYLPTPAMSGRELRAALAKELGLQPDGDGLTLTESLHQSLIERKRGGRAVVVLLDEAQALPDEALEALRLLGNLETEQEKLLHIVLLGQPELDARLASPQLRQFRQRITFRAVLRPLDMAETVSYIEHRLSKAGGEAGLMPLARQKAIWHASRGIPRLVNQLCHKALIVACSTGEATVSRKAVQAAIRDTQTARQPRWHDPILWGWS